MTSPALDLKGAIVDMTTSYQGMMTGWECDCRWNIPVQDSSIGEDCVFRFEHTVPWDGIIGLRHQDSFMDNVNGRGRSFVHRSDYTKTRASSESILASEMEVIMVLVSLSNVSDGC